MSSLANDRHQTQQLLIWPGADDIQFKSPGHASPYVGDWAEEYVAQLWGGQRLTTQAGCDCPDLLLAPGHHGEVKAVSARMNFIIYRRRYEQMKRWTAEHGTRLWLVLVIHDLTSSQFKTRDHMRRILPTRLQHVVLLSSQTVLKEVRRMLKEKGGWAQAPGRLPAYQEYVRMSRSWIRYFTDTKPHIPRRTFAQTVYDQRVPPVSFRAYKCTPPGEPQIGWHPESHRLAAAELLQELEDNRLDVMVDHSTRRRIVTAENAEWYRRLCAEYPAKTKREWTTIQRRNVRRALMQMIKDRPVRGNLEQQLLPYVEERWEQMLLEKSEQDVPF